MRNQPRKRVDLTMEGFSLFAKDKPSSVKLYMHMGVQDQGWNIVQLSYRFGIYNRLIITGTQNEIQEVPEGKLNYIYNSCDVGINTSVGEGWGLVAHEHAATGALQIVPDHSACRELFEDCGILIPARINNIHPGILTTGKLVVPEDVADALELAYSNEVLRAEFSEKGYKKFSSNEYTWKDVVNTKWLPLFREIYGV
jgi:glycosyltransferase involved in cell wall biosynthesis